MNDSLSTRAIFPRAIRKTWLVRCLQLTNHVTLRLHGKIGGKSVSQSVSRPAPSWQEDDPSLSLLHPSIGKLQATTQLMRKPPSRRPQIRSS